MHNDANHETERQSDSGHGSDDEHPVRDDERHHGEHAAPATASGTIGIIDDDRRSLDSMSRLIQDRIVGLEILWTVTDPEKGLRLSLDRGTQPDLVLIDMTMETMPGEDICRRIRHRNAVIQLLGMVASTKNKHGAHLAASGAQGIVSKNSETDFIDGIVTVLHGGTYGTHGFLSATDSYDRLKDEQPVDSDQVSARQAQVMNLMAAGMTDLHIADDIGIAEGTVRKHAQIAMAKLHVQNRVQAVLAWNELQGGRPLQKRYLRFDHHTDGECVEKPESRREA